MPCHFDSYMHVGVRHVGDVVTRAVSLNKSTHFILVTVSQMKARQAPFGRQTVHVQLIPPMHLDSNLSLFALQGFGLHMSEND